MSKLRYKPSDFASMSAREKRPITCQVTDREYYNLRANAEFLGTDMSKLVYRCLLDAGVFGESEKATKKKNVDSQPAATPPQGEEGVVQDDLPI